MAGRMTEAGRRGLGVKGVSGVGWGVSAPRTEGRVDDQNDKMPTLEVSDECSIRGLKEQRWAERGREGRRPRNTLVVTSTAVLHKGRRP